jgi:hypothetical protein
MNKKGLSGIVVILILAVLVVGVYFLFFRGGDTGILKLQITDAPASLNISKALVTISSIEVHLAPGSVNESNVNGTNESSEENVSTGWFTVVEGPVTYDLIAIKDVKEVLGSKNLTAGKYTQVRLSVDEAVVTIDGVEHNLSISSGKIKLIQGFDIEAGKTTTLTLDFDAAESIRETGNGSYRMNPTIKIIQE